MNKVTVTDKQIVGFVFDHDTLGAVLPTTLADTTSFVPCSVLSGLSNSRCLLLQDISRLLLVIVVVNSIDSDNNSVRKCSV
jgi:hypothetical protein